MPRKTQSDLSGIVDLSCMSEFARWLLTRKKQRGVTLSTIARQTGINISYLYKITKSHLPQYEQYKRLSFEKTVQIGEYLGDVGGAVRAGGYSETYQAAMVGDLTLRPIAFAGSHSRIASADHVAEHEDPASWVPNDSPERAEDWPPELLEAMHYSRTLDRETQRYIYGLWREQARVYAAVNQNTVNQNNGENSNTGDNSSGEERRGRKSSRKNGSSPDKPAAGKCPY